MKWKRFFCAITAGITFPLIWLFIGISSQYFSTNSTSTELNSYAGIGLLFYGIMLVPICIAGLPAWILIEKNAYGILGQIIVVVCASFISGMIGFVLMNNNGFNDLLNKEKSWSAFLRLLDPLKIMLQNGFGIWVFYLFALKLLRQPLHLPKMEKRS